MTAAGREPRRVEPDPHGVLALAEDDHVADAGHALQGVAHVRVQVVADEARAVAVVLGEEAQPAHEARGVLGDGHAEVADVGGQAAHHLVDPVLDVDRREVGVARDLEVDVDRRDPAVGARGLHVRHALDAVHDLLDRRGDGALDRLRVGARVEGRDRHRRRRQLGVARDRKPRDADRSREDDQERADRRQDRPADEDVGGQG